MTGLINLPFTRCFVRRSFVRQQGDETGVIEAYLIAVCLVINEAPKLMILTHEGAAFCYVPPNAICFREDAEEKKLGDVCAWDCLAGRGEIVHLQFLLNWQVTILHDTWVQTGRYMFTLHFDPARGWSRIPEQLKLFHFIEGDDGNLHIGVNNKMKWDCDAITGKGMDFIPQENRQVYFSED